METLAYFIGLKEQRKNASDAVYKDVNGSKGCTAFCNWKFESIAGL